MTGGIWLSTRCLKNILRLFLGRNYYNWRTSSHMRYIRIYHSHWCLRSIFWSSSTALIGISFKGPLYILIELRIFCNNWRFQIVIVHFLLWINWPLGWMRSSRYQRLFNHQLNCSRSFIIWTQTSYTSRRNWISNLIGWRVVETVVLSLITKRWRDIVGTRSNLIIIKRGLWSINIVYSYITCIISHHEVRQGWLL